MSITGELAAFSDIPNESNDISQLTSLIRGTANQIIVTQQPTYVQLSTPQDIAPTSAFTCASLTDSNLTANELVSADSASSLQSVTISTNNNGNTSNLSADGKTLTFTLQQNVSTSGTPTFAGETLTGNLTMGTNSISSVGSITSSGNFNNGTNSMTTGSVACNAVNISGLSGPNIVSIDAKGNLTTADITVDNAILGGDASGNIAGVTIANTSNNGITSTLSYNGSTRTLTLAANASQNLSTSGSPQFLRETLQGGGSSGSSLSITCGSGGVNGIVVNDPSVAGSILIAGGSGTTTYEVAMGNYNPSGAGSGFAIGTNAAASFPQMYMFNKTADTSPTLYLQDTKANNIFIANTSSMTVPSIVCGVVDTLVNSDATIVGHGISASLSGTACCVMGFQAGHALSTGNSNSFFGYKAGSSITTQTNNTHLGAGAGQANTGNQNTFLGGGAGINGSGDQNVAIGLSSLNALSSGHNNVCIGYAAGATPTTGLNNIIIGSGADVGATGASNRIVIGQGATNANDNSAIIGNSSITDISPGVNTCTLGSKIAFSTINSTGINFGGNTLSNYISATSWTPFLCSDGAGTHTTGTVYATQVGSYIRIGNLAFVSFNIITSTKPTNVGTTALRINLPVTSSSDNQGTFNVVGGNNALASTNIPYVQVNNSSTTMALDYFISGGATFTFTVASWNNNSQVSGMVQVFL